MSRLLLTLVPLVAVIASGLADSAARQGPRAAATVEGTVYDSIAHAPLAGVTVHFANAENPGARSHSALTDDEGRYSLADIAPGRYLAAFFTTPLDSLGLESPPREVTIRDGRQRIDLATPSAATLTRAVCGEYGDSTALLIGHVRRTSTLEPIAGAGITVEWSEIVVDASGLRNRDRRVSSETEGPGFFAFCGLPGEVAVTARASLGSDSTGFVEIALPPGELRHFTFNLGGADLVESVIAVTNPDTAADALTSVTVRRWHGEARLAGTVRTVDGRPVEGASVTVWGTERSVTTNDRGAFAMDSLPGGTQTVDVRLIGYQPVRQAVQLAPREMASVDLVLADRVVVLEDVKVRGELVYGRNLAEFERRARMAPNNYVLRPEEIERRPVTPLSRLLQGLPGVWVVCTGGRCLVRMRGSPSFNGSKDCEPSLWIDGRKDLIGEYEILYSDEIAAVEIYPRPAMVPSEFYEAERCGAIVVTTRPRPTKLPDPPKR